MKYQNEEVMKIACTWFAHYEIIKSKFLEEMVKYVSDDTYKISWEVLRVFAEYAQKHFESLTE